MTVSWSPEERDRIAAELRRRNLAPWPERERVVLELYFLEEWTLTAIADSFDLSRARVAQIRDAALRRIATRRGRDGVWCFD